MFKKIIPLALALMVNAAHAETFGGTATLSVSTGSNQVALPASTTKYPAILLQPGYGTTVNIFFNFGTSGSVTASTSSTILPGGGVCLTNVGAANTNIAAIAVGGTATLYVSQLSTCPQLVWGFNNGGSSPPVTCSNALDYSQACNSQYFVTLLF